ncbi:MAG: LapA family protein [Nitrospira sp.]|nr:LapA family protein [Nitrospira sp.]
MGKLIVAVVFALLIAMFAIQNHSVVTVRLFSWEYETSLALVILSAVTIGALLTFVASLGSRIRRTRESRELATTVRRQGERIRELEKSDQKPPVSEA